MKKLSLLSISKKIKASENSRIIDLKQARNITGGTHKGKPCGGVTNRWKVC